MTEAVMQVQKRNGRIEDVQPFKIANRLNRLKKDVEEFLGRPLEINVQRIADATLRQIYPSITTSEIDEQAASIASEIVDHPDYLLFAGNILVSNLEANNRDDISFVKYAEKAYKFVEERTGKNHPLISEEEYRCAKKYGHLIDRKIDMRRNFLYDYFGISTLIKGQYLLSSYRTVQLNGRKQRAMVPFETPQHNHMRLALGIAGSRDLDFAFEIYDVLSHKNATFATPTILYAGTPRPSCVSCFLAYTPDSINGIYDSLKEVAQISKGAGGVGFHVQDVRGAGSYIAGTNGVSSGVIPMLKVFEATAKYVDQGGGKRYGSFAAYTELWHPDIEDIINAKRPDTHPNRQLLDLFFGLWIPDLFMQRAEKHFQRDDEDPPVLWSLIDPTESRRLADLVGEEFTVEYERLEREKKYVKQLPVQDLLYLIASACVESGGPYLLFKDHCNRKSNQKNLGTIRSSNLCSEIIEYSDQNETACCNLASLGLPTFVENGRFNYEKLMDVVRVMVRALNNVIDINHYPNDKTRRSNERHRPIGLGIQGLADTFALLEQPFDSEEARLTNIRIAECIYYAALDESTELAVKYGPYVSIDEGKGAPILNGITHWELCNQFDPSGAQCRPDPFLNLDWDNLKQRIRNAKGTRNSLLIALMPTASTSCIMGNNESFEPFHSNIYVRKTKAGEFLMVNPHMVRNLSRIGCWNTEIFEKIKANHGSLSGIAEIPQKYQELHKTTSDLDLKVLTLMARDRGYFVDQSMSLNVYYKSNDPNLVETFIRYLAFAWKLGLKTASYYTHVIQDTTYLQAIRKTQEPTPIVCSKRKPGESACAACEG